MLSDDLQNEFQMTIKLYRVIHITKSCFVEVKIQACGMRTSYVYQQKSKTITDSSLVSHMKAAVNALHAT